MTHLCGVVKNPEGWRAECSCGWLGPYRVGILEAAADAGEHKMEQDTEEKDGT